MSKKNEVFIQRDSREPQINMPIIQFQEGRVRFWIFDFGFSILRGCGLVLSFSRGSVGERFWFSEKVLVFPRFLAFGELFQNIFTANSRFFGIFKRAPCRFLEENRGIQAEFFPRGFRVVPE
jgi:hypothetical protein